MTSPASAPYSIRAAALPQPFVCPPSVAANSVRTPPPGLHPSHFAAYPIPYWTDHRVTRHLDLLRHPQQASPSWSTCRCRLRPSSFDSHSQFSASLIDRAAHSHRIDTSKPVAARTWTLCLSYWSPKRKHKLELANLDKQSEAVRTDALLSPTPPPHPDARRPICECSAHTYMHTLLALRPGFFSPLIQQDPS